MYFITVLNIKGEYVSEQRCVGYVDTLEEAKRIMSENCCDIFEDIYDWGIIENVPMGIYQYDINPIWFKYNYELGEATECKSPLKNQCGFGIG